MAGVIGQLTANARKRRREAVIDSSKCVYVLPVFHSHGYSPSNDNQFVLRRARVEERIQSEKSDIRFLENWYLEKQVIKFLGIF